MEVQDTFGALDRLLRQFENLLGGLDRLGYRVAHDVIGQPKFDRLRSRDPRTG